MLTRRIIPCLDVRAGRVVKGVQFQNLRDVGDPATLALLHERTGADELVVLDITATDEARPTQLATIRAIRSAIGIPLTVGGGVRAVADVEALLAAGADKVAVNTAGILNPPLFTLLADRFGSQCVVASIDTRLNPDRPSGRAVVSHAGKQLTQLDAAEWAAEAESRGAGEVLLTSWDRDGTGEGFDLGGIAAVRNAINLPLIASGGASTADHLIAAVHAGADALLAATIFHRSPDSIAAVKASLASAGIAIRLLA